MDLATTLDIMGTFLDGPAPVGAAEFDRAAQLLEECSVPRDSEIDLEFRRQSLVDLYFALAELARLDAARGRMPEADRLHRIETCTYVFCETSAGLFREAYLTGGMAGLERAVKYQPPDVQEMVLEAVPREVRDQIWEDGHERIT